MTSPNLLWQSCLKYIKQNVTPEEFDRWFSGVDLESYNESNRTLKLWVPSLYISEYIDQHYTELLIRTFRLTFGKIRLLWHPIVVKKNERNAPKTGQPAEHHGIRGKGPVIESINTRDEDKDLSSKMPRQLAKIAGVQDTFLEPSSQQETSQMQLPEIDSQLTPTQTFRNFVEGTSNKLCRSVGLSIAEHPNTTQFNPMFVYGPSGCGKTHLVNAMGLRCKELFPNKRVLYVPARIFVVQYTNAVMENQFNDFINFYQTIDMLIVDDVQEWDVSTQKATHQAFFHIFNHLFRNGKRIILVSDRPPVELQNLSTRLLTRFSCGLVAEMEKPNTQLCVDILRRKIARDGLSIPMDVVQYIAENANGSVRDLEGIINSLMAYSVVENCNINMQLAERVIKRTVRVNDGEISDQAIIEAVCKQYEISEMVLKGRTRRHEIVIPRQLAMYLLKKHVNMPMQRIGKVMGGRDHTTVIHAISQTESRLKKDPEFAQMVKELEKSFAKK